jgi:hypothetical protein
MIGLRRSDGSQGGLDVWPLGLRSVPLKKPGCGQRGLELDLALAANLVTRQKLGLEVDRSCLRFAPVGEDL